MSDTSPDMSKVQSAIVGGGGAVWLSPKWMFLTSAGIAALWIAYKKFMRSKKKPSTPKKPSKSSAAADRLREPPSVWFRHLLIHVFQRKENVATVIILVVLLLLRTLASVKVANDLGKAAELMVQRDVRSAAIHIATFGLITIPIAAINSGIRATTELFGIQTRHVLSKLVHEHYLQDTKVYDVRYWCPEDEDGKRAIAISDAHQRVTRDVHELSTQISTLVSSVFKPLLDLMVFSSNVKREMGWQGLGIIWTYYIFVFFVKSRTGPAFARLSRKAAELEGAYSSAEQRLSDNAEEVVFFGGAERERGLLSDMLRRLTKQGYQSVYTLFGVGVLDQYLAKYLASVAGYITLSVPVIFNLDSIKGKSTADLTAAYSRNSRYLLNMGTAIREIALVSNKLGRAYGLVTRVAELLERLEGLMKEPKRAPLPKSTITTEKHTADSMRGSGWEDLLERWKSLCDEWRPFTGDEAIEFKDVRIVAPDRRLLVSNLSLCVQRGDHILLTGPNGAGKSSIFRALGGLWPTASGSITRTPGDLQVFFLTQNPYFVSGTLRDQILYPLDVSGAIARCGLADDAAGLEALDAHLVSLLDVVDGAKDIPREMLAREGEWARLLSGGQRQLVSMARLAFHRPCFALLDECTSAVSADKDSLIFDICGALGITILSISHKSKIHRQYHTHELRLSGAGDGSYTFQRITEAQKSKARELSAAAH